MTTKDWVVTQQPLLHVDAAPDAAYPLRILEAYRWNCDCRFVETTDGREPASPLLRMMNEDCERRAAILDNAIAILKRSLL